MVPQTSQAGASLMLSMATVSVEASGAGAWAPLLAPFEPFEP